MLIGELHPSLYVPFPRDFVAFRPASRLRLKRFLDAPKRLLILLIYLLINYAEAA